MNSRLDNRRDPSWGATVTHLRQRALAERWDLSVRTLERWRSEGQGPPFLKLGGRVCYRLDDILEFEEAQRQVGTSCNSADGGRR